KLWPLIRATPSLIWLLLTKRSDRIASSLPTDWDGDSYRNVALGVSIESKPYYGRAIDLLRVPGDVVRFISAEPLLEEIRPPLFYGEHCGKAVVGYNPGSLWGRLWGGGA